MPQKKVALVTGAGRGIGRAIAQRLAADGYAVAVASRSRAQLDQVVAEIHAAGGTAQALVCDVTRQEESPVPWMACGKSSARSAC